MFDIENLTCGEVTYDDTLLEQQVPAVFSTATELFTFAYAKHKGTARLAAADRTDIEKGLDQYFQSGTLPRWVRVYCETHKR